MTIFGTIITGRQVRDATERTLRLWAPAYVAEIGRQDGRPANALPVMRSYVSSVTFDGPMPEDQVPACVIVAPGILGEPVRHGDGTHEATWAVGIGVVVSGQDQENTADLANLYAAVVRTIMLQHPSLGGFATGLRWLDERYDPLPTEDRRTFGAAIVQFAVVVPSVVDANGGPAEPPDDPTTDPGEWPSIQSVLVTVDRKA